jgi:hypothetical protein
MGKRDRETPSPREGEGWMGDRLDMGHRFPDKS